MADANASVRVHSAVAAGYPGRGDPLARAAAACSAAAALVGLLGLLGWALGLRALISLQPDYKPIAPDTALCFLVLGLTILISVRRPLGRRGSLVAAAASVLVATYGLFVLVGYLTGMSISWGKLLFPTVAMLGPFPGGRMSPVSSVSFILAGAAVALNLLARRRRTQLDLANGLGTLVAAAGFAGAIGYLFKTPLLYGSDIIPMAALSTAAFALLGTGLVAAAGRDGLVLRPLAGPSVRARLLRTFLPLAAGMILTESFLREVIAEPLGINSAALSALFTLLFAMIAGLAVTWAARGIASTLDSAEAERKRTDDALRAERNLLRTLIDSMPGPVYVKDREGRFLASNTETARLMGSDSPTDLMGNTDFDFYPQAMAARYRTDEDGILQSGEPLIEHEEPRTDQRGEVRWISTTKVPLRDEQGRVVGIVGVGTDISERKKAEISLQQYAQRLELLREVDHAILSAQSLEELMAAALARIRRLVPCQRAGTLVLDSRDETATVFVAEADGESCALAGAFLPLKHSMPAPGEVQQVDDVLALAEPPLAVEALGLQGVRSFVSAPLTADGELSGSLTVTSSAPGAFGPEHLEIVRDVADQLSVAMRQTALRRQIERHAVELEQRVAERTLQLQAANRELETFTYSVSHDLKAPLRGIDGYSRLLLEDYAGQLDEQGARFLHTIRQATVQMSRLIDDLLAYSRLERRSLATGRVNPRALIEALLAERDAELRARDVAVSVDVPCESVTAEAEGLAQALRNLLDNALKFTRDIAASRIEIGGREDDRTCLLWVRDNGVGFDMQYGERIFEIFQRLQRAEDYPGTGIGLAIVRKCMQRIGGRAWAESAPGQGATFYLEIPK